MVEEGRVVVSARELIGSGAFPPDVLHILFEAFDDAWAEVVADVEQQPAAIEAARMTLAGIVLTLGRVGPVDRFSIMTAAVDAFRQMHHLEHPS
jgi:hypothetical protein